MKTWLAKDGVEEPMFEEPAQSLDLNQNEHKWNAIYATYLLAA